MNSKSCLIKAKTYILRDYLTLFPISYRNIHKQGNQSLKSNSRRTVAPKRMKTNGNNNPKYKTNNYIKK
jgi:hypothetical protein